MKLEDVFVTTGLTHLQNTEPENVLKLLDEFWKEPEKRMAATDFDQSLIRDDIGIIAFQESLQLPAYWNFTDEEFKQVLSPKDASQGNLLSYRELVEKTASQNITTSRRVEEGAKQLKKLFKALERSYKILRYNPKDRLIREKFSREMLEFDEVVLSMEPFFSDFYGNQIHSRTRFLAGKTTDDVKALSLNLLNEGRVQINESVFSILEEVKKRGALLNIVTTNLFSVVRGIVGESVLNTIFSEDDVIATKHVGKGEHLEAENGSMEIKESIKLSPHIEGEPVFGKRKVELLKQQSVISNRRFSLAIGDSVVNDGPMIAESIKNKGVSIIVVPSGANLNEVVRMFERKVRDLLAEPYLLPDQKQRMWYLQSNRFSDARQLQCNR
jgi:hypothetical protein